VSETRGAIDPAVGPAVRDQVLGARILIVDDQAPNVRLLQRLLQASGYREIRTTTDPRSVLALYGELRPDLLLLDLHMPYKNGYTILKELADHLAAERYLPVLVLTADSMTEARQKALAMGAKDFLAKPFDIVEVVLRIRNLLETRFRYLHLEQQTRDLERQVQARTRELEEARHEILDRLALAADYRDDNTGEHTRRVGQISGLLARAVGLGRSQVELIRRAAPLHDVGKIGIPDAVLTKPAPLTPDEFALVQTHTTIGARILSGSRVALLRMAQEIALGHHERWDGTGYPGGLEGEAIPLSARIVALADAFDAMTHARPYKSAVSVPEAVRYVERAVGTHFDPALGRAFLALARDGAALTGEG